MKGFTASPKRRQLEGPIAEARGPWPVVIISHTQKLKLLTRTSSMVASNWGNLYHPRKETSHESHLLCLSGFDLPQIYRAKYTCPTMMKDVVVGRLKINLYPPSNVSMSPQKKLTNVYKYQTIDRDIASSCGPYIISETLESLLEWDFLVIQEPSSRPLVIVIVRMKVSGTS